MRCDFLRDLLRIDAAGSVINIGKDRLCAAMQNGACGGSKRHRRGDNLVSGADVLCEQRNVQGGRAGIHGDSVLGSEILRELFLKFKRPGTFGDPA